MPPVIRLVDAGIRQVSTTVVEAATAAGSTERQLLWKVQLPLSRRALLVASTRASCMVLAMVVVGGLVGAGALGYDVVAGFSQHEDFGKGLAAGIAIVLLGIMLDRITQGAGGRPSTGAARGGQHRPAPAPDSSRLVDRHRGGDERACIEHERPGWRPAIAVLGIVLAACSSGGGSSTAPSAGAGESRRRAPAPATRAPSRSPSTRGSARRPTSPSSSACSRPSSATRSRRARLAEELAWPGFETGDIDAILENWGHPDLEKPYITDKKVAAGCRPERRRPGSSAGTSRHWMVEEYPDILDWHNLNKYADLFKTSESGGKGQFLASDPTFVTNDEALIANLDLNYKAVYSGSEAADHRVPDATEQKKTPLIGYFYDPQWLHSQIKLDKVNLPAWTEGCDADPRRSPATTRRTR